MDYWCAEKTSIPLVQIMKKSRLVSPLNRNGSTRAEHPNSQSVTQNSSSSFPHKVIFEGNVYYYEAHPNKVKTYRYAVDLAMNILLSSEQTQVRINPTINLKPRISADITVSTKVSFHQKTAFLLRFKGCNRNDLTQWFTTGGSQTNILGVHDQWWS